MSDAARGPAITAVIPAYNRETTVARSLQSVLDQTSPVDSIIVVDDGSSDGTVAKIEEFGDSVRLIRQANAGAAAARNTGVDAAETKWVAFLDSDDYWEADHIEKMRAAIAATDGVSGFYFADMFWPSSGGSLFDLCGFSAKAPFTMIEDATDWVMLAQQPTMLQASVISREKYRGIGGMLSELKSRHDTHLFFLLGIGQPGCAVAHRGTIMTDDATGGRVTEVLGDQGRPYWWETAVMYRDVLAKFPGLSAQHRADLHSRLSSAELKLAQFALRGCNPIGFTWHAFGALRQSPGRFRAALGRRFGLHR